MCKWLPGSWIPMLPSFYKAGKILHLLRTATLHAWGISKLNSRAHWGLGASRERHSGSQFKLYTHIPQVLQFRKHKNVSGYGSRFLGLKALCCWLVSGKGDGVCVCFVLSGSYCQVHILRLWFWFRVVVFPAAQMPLEEILNLPELLFYPDVIQLKRKSNSNKMINATWSLIMLFNKRKLIT